MEPEKGKITVEQKLFENYGVITLKKLYVYLKELEKNNPECLNLTVKINLLK